MLSYNRGGKALPLAGFFLTVVGVVLTVLGLRSGAFETTELFACSSCFLFGLPMIFLFARVEIDPDRKVVNLIYGLRFRPRKSVRNWSEFDAVVAFEPTGMNASDSSYGLYLREKESGERSVLVQQYQDLDNIHEAARQISQMMGISALKSRRDEESELV